MREWIERLVVRDKVIVQRGKPIVGTVSRKTKTLVFVTESTGGGETPYRIRDGVRSGYHSIPHATHIEPATPELLAEAIRQRQREKQISTLRHRVAWELLSDDQLQAIEDVIWPNDKAPPTTLQT